jgi:hypothetical protein
MAKGLCCAAAAAGDLGKSLVVSIHKKDGSISRRCGVCEVAPSCRDPQKLVFRFKFLASADCGLAAAGKCTPTAAQIAQYDAARIEAAGHPVLTYNGAGGNVFAPYTPARVPAGYTLPLS